MTRFPLSATLGIALLGAAALPTLALGQGEAPRHVIAIMDFTNSSLQDHDVYQPFTAGVAGMLLTALRPNPRVQLVERDQLRKVLDELALGQSGQVDPATAAQVGKLIGARHMIFGVFFIGRKGDLRIDARAVNVQTGLVEHVETVSDDADNLLRAVEKLGRQLSERLKLPALSAQPARATPEAPKGQRLANLKYARALQEEDRKNPARAIQLYREFLAESPVGYAVDQRSEAENRIKLLSGGSE